MKTSTRLFMTFFSAAIICSLFSMAYTYSTESAASEARASFMCCARKSSSWFIEKSTPLFMASLISISFWFTSSSDRPVRSQMEWSR